MQITAALMVCTKKHPNISEEEVKNSVWHRLWITCREEPDIRYIAGINCLSQVWAAEELIRVAKKVDGCKVSIICSYPGMENKCDTIMKKRIKKILKAADEVVYLAKNPNKQSFELCNEWLLKHSDMLIPIYIGNKEQYDKIIQMAINTEHGYTG